MTEFRKPYPPHLFLLLPQSKAVKRTLAVFAAALFAVSLAATGATAATARPAPTNPAVAECFKQSGGSYNPVTKRWAIFGDEGNMSLKSDTLRQCLGRATGASSGSIKIHESCDRPPCY